MLNGSVIHRQVLRMKDGQVWDKQSLYMKAIELDGMGKPPQQKVNGCFWFP